MDSTFKFQEMSEAELKVEKEIIPVISGLDSEVFEELKKQLHNIDSETKLRIAFVGQHNAGKSTIVSALTGDKSIKISSNVETDDVSQFQWGDVLIYDTPGLCAGVKEEHDASSLKAIETADVLVFCITSSLFDDLMIEKFVELAYKRGFKNKIILVVNKLSQEDNDPEVLIYNYSLTLQKTLSEQGANVSDFPIAFIDAKDYKEATEEEDEELIEFSRFNDFIALLNAYIKERGLLAKVITKCNLLSDIIARIIADVGTEADQNMIILLNRLSRIIKKSKKDMRYVVDQEERKMRNELLGLGESVSALIGKEDIDEDKQREINNNVESIVAACVERIEEKLQNFVDELNDEIGDILASDIGMHVFGEMNNEEYHANNKTYKQYGDFIEKYGNVQKMVAKGSEYVAAKAVKAGMDFGKLANSSGTSLHTVVVNVGHFFGHKFKPWEALKITNKIGKVAKVAGPILAGLGVALDLVDKVHQEKQLKEIQEAKNICFNSFSSMASDIIIEIDKQFEKLEKEVFDEKMGSIDNIRNSMIEEARNNNESVKLLKDNNKELKLLVDRITSLEEETFE